jgi:hypothetical protein
MEFSNTKRDLPLHTYIQLHTLPIRNYNNYTTYTNKTTVTKLHKYVLAYEATTNVRNS